MVRAFFVGCETVWGLSSSDVVTLNLFQGLLFFPALGVLHDGP